MPIEYRDKVLAIIRMRGPVLPADIAKALSLTTLLASAVLSELVSKGVLKISSVKVGGSPLYFLKGQEIQLEKYKHHLNEKDQRTFELLKNERILQDKTQSPLVRVSLRQIKDFAVPISVKIKTGEELFWKWYTLTNEEATPVVKRLLGIKEKAFVKKEKLPETMQPEQKERKIEAAQKTLEKPKQAQDVVDNFLDIVLAFFSKNNISVIERAVVRKKKELDFIVELPSPVGRLKYYCKAKNKKRVTEADLSTAYVQGQAKKLPVLFITPGNLSKKANEMRSVEFSNMTVTQL